jgi:hypothetical protein
MKLKRLLAIIAPAILAASSAQASEVKVYLSQPGRNAALTAAIPDSTLPWPSTYTVPYVMETFNPPARSAGLIPAPYTGAWDVGTYVTGATQLTRISSPDIFGGAGTGTVPGPGNAGSQYLISGSEPGLTVTFTSPARYVGFWWSAGSAGNFVELLDQNDNVLVQLDTTDIIAFLSSAATFTALDGTIYNNSQYFGNPFTDPQGDPGGSYVYINIALDNSVAPTTVIKKIRLWQDAVNHPNSLFELDNLAMSKDFPEPPPGSWVETNLKITIIDPPVTADDTYTTAMNQPAGALDLLANDPYAPTGSTTTAGPASANGGTVAADPGNPGKWLYTPPTGFTGDDTFTYTVCLAPPDNALCSTSTVTVHVLAVAPPVTVNDTYSTNMDQPIGALDLLGNDTLVPAGSTTTAGPASAKGGTVAADPGNPGKWLYTPPVGFTGDDTFTYTVCLPPPNGALCSTATVTIHVLVPFKLPLGGATPVPTLAAWNLVLLALLAGGMAAGAVRRRG